MLFLLACQSPPPPPSSAPPPPAAVPPPDVVLVSLDTVRADFTDPVTAPNLARLAATGTRFTWALSHAPTTLSSHASIWTGLDTHGHRVVRNGFPLPPEVTTLPERFRDAGYDTIGIAGASVLDASTGFTRGFRTWDADFELDRVIRHEALAADVTDRALAGIATRKPGKPLFLFVHYFDAHAPYDAPAPWTRIWGAPGYDGYYDGSPKGSKHLAEELRAKKADPAHLAEARARYRGEISYVDAELGRLLATLAPSTVVLVFGDHGEVLGEIPNRPLGHGFDIDLVASHVPLVVSGPGVPAGRVIEDVVGLQGIGPTLLSLAGLASRGSLLDGAPQVVFMEATQPHELGRTDAWPNLPLERGVAHDRFLLLSAPWLHEEPALYALSSGQPKIDDAPVRDAMARELETWDAKAPGYTGAHMTDETKAALRALGYVE